MAIAPAAHFGQLARLVRETPPGRAVDVDYGAPVSYGIRRCELDAELLRRAEARVRAGERVREIRYGPLNKDYF